MQRKILLPAFVEKGGIIRNDERMRQQMLEMLCRRHSGKRWTTYAWIEEVYPDEKGWIESESDEKSRVYYARVVTVREKRS